MAKAGAHVQEYALLDSQYFGIAQRRRRVFLLSIFDTDIASRCADPILPVSEGMSGDTKQSQTTRQSTATTARTSLTFTKSRRAQSVDDFETWVEGDISPTLNQFDVGDVRTTTAVAELVLFENSYRDGARVADTEITQTLTAKMGTGGGNTPMIAYSIREDAKAGNFSATEISAANSLQAHQPSVQSHHAQTFIASDALVRRLLPIETERLMGWPDDHTRWKADGTEQADSHRYRQVGNGVASPVATWIGEQIRVYL